MTVSAHYCGFPFCKD